MFRDYRIAVVLTLAVCALSSRTTLAKRHHPKHKPSITTPTTSTASTTSAGTLTLGTSSYRGANSVFAGTLLVPPSSYQGLIITSGIEALTANPVGTLTLVNSYQNIPTVSFGTLTPGNIASIESSTTLVANTAQLIPDSAGVLSVQLGNFLSSMGTLEVTQPVTYFGDLNLLSFQQPVASLPLWANSNLVIASDGMVSYSGTLSDNAAEPTGLGLAAIAALAFLSRRPRT